MLFWRVRIWTINWQLPHTLSTDASFEGWRKQHKNHDLLIWAPSFEHSGRLRLDKYAEYFCMTKCISSAVVYRLHVRFCIVWSGNPLTTMADSTEAISEAYGLLYPSNLVTILIFFQNLLGIAHCQSKAFCKHCPWFRKQDTRKVSTYQAICRK